MDYGRKLEVINNIKKDKIMCAAVKDQYLYFGGANYLYIADITLPQKPRLITEFFIQGDARQLIVRDNTVFITAREQGVYIIDVANPACPILLCHYDTIELATGICAAGNLMFVAQRQYGVEIVDITDLRKPAHISRIKTDEAQSVDAANNYLYVGDWGTRQLTTIDIRNPGEPFVTSQKDLVGYGDGVYVYEGHVYASTGHHSAKNIMKKDDPHYGSGHGLEIFDLADPANPKFLSRIQFPRFYMLGNDMWSVQVSGGYAYCSDTFNGVFIINVSDPNKPFAVGYYDGGFVGGLAVIEGYLYAACADKGLVVLEARGIAERCVREEAQCVSVPAQKERTAGACACRMFRPGGQVWAVDFIDGYALVAAGIKGLMVVKLWPEIKPVYTVQTAGFALYVDVFDDKVFISEGSGGFSIWKYKGHGQLVPIGKYCNKDMLSVRMGKIYASGRYAILLCKNSFEVLDLEEPQSPKMVAEYSLEHTVYGDQMSEGCIDGRYACVFKHSFGMRYIDLGAEPQHMFTDVFFSKRCSLSSGVAALGRQFLVTYEGGYRLIAPMEESIESRDLIVYGGNIIGKPRIYGDYLFISDRISSRIEVVNIKDPRKPTLYDKLKTGGNPGGITIYNNALIIPDGYNGLLIYDHYFK